MDILKEKFADYFEELTGWGLDQYPNQQYVRDMWGAFCAGHDAWCE